MQCHEENAIYLHKQLPENINAAKIISSEQTISTKKSDTQNEVTQNNLEPVKPEITAIANNEEDTHTIDDYPLEPDGEQYSTIKRSPHSKSNSLQSPDETSSSNNTDTALFQDDEEEVMRTKVSVTVQQSQSQSEVTNKNGYLGERNESKHIITLIFYLYI